MDLDEFLEFATANDELGLLTVKAKTSAPTADEHLLAKFNEINDFVTAKGREPEPDMANVPEYMLNQRLNAIRDNAEQCAALSEFDAHGLLPAIALEEVAEPEAEYAVVTEPKEIESLDDIFSDDALGLLDDGAESIFTMKHVPQSIDMPSKIAKRKRCKDFEQYEDLFKACHADLKSGEREQHKFTGEQQIQQGQFFVLHGVMCYVADTEERVKKNGKVNAKLHLIFENGTESNMLLRSLATELYKDETGRRVMPKSENALDGMLGIKEDDQASGYIYILQSLSVNPEISSIQNLYKIGYANTSVEKRIANAAKEPTYLMAPVHHVSSYQCFNMNAQKFENLLHTFFGKACLDIEVADSTGKMCKPREWFIAPLKAIEMAILLLTNGEIVHYRYDLVSEQVVER
ncbi:GIY-YIG nuclease family protein [Umboniibacter marinipuniceus]|uniref:T5orf172 domain-containing protein n=1 Tax=Umboniibacter marinipuniceus TaxID=569599 RepID=A0A3M0AJG6_9GAMM|nr:GIY-YIG nuclease family protein [Umboniibacter marinipuniceus]RMA82715.1 T5orf172 domain-containing protein [Umboniibacter marinipuniceus]